MESATASSMKDPMSEIEAGSQRRLDLRTPLTVEKLLDIYQQNKPAGIQDANNSCYLDTTIFAMFGLNNSFDYILSSPVESANIRVRVMRETLLELVNELRKDGYVKSQKKQVVRELMKESYNQPCQNLSGNEQENDPINFIDIVFGRIVQIELILRSDELLWTNLCIFVPGARDMSQINYGTNQCIASQESKNFILNEIPDNLILKLPIFLPKMTEQKSSPKFAVPSPILDITDHLDLEPKICCMCGLQATIKCLKCFGIFSKNMNSVFFCKRCMTKCHTNVSEDRDVHLEESLNSVISDDKSWTFPKRVVMHLHSVICSYRHHYTCFAKSGVEKGGQWLYYNSMTETDNKEYVTKMAPADEFDKCISTQSIGTLLQFVPVELDNDVFPDLSEWNQDEGNMLYGNGAIAFYNQPKKIYL